MRKLLFFILTLSLFTNFTFADTYVKGYYRSNGTYVNGYYRSDADGNPYNNFSFPGNTNPYTGVTASGNSSTYLNNYYNNSSSNYNSYIPTYSPTYNPNTYNNLNTYTPSYVSGTYITNSLYQRTQISGGYKLGDIVFCDTGYYESGGSCVLTPSNSTSGYTTFFCNAGYVKSLDGKSCTSDFDAKYQACVNKGYDTYSVAKYSCECNYDKSAYSVNGSAKCMTKDEACKQSFGSYSISIGGDNCGCASGYEMQGTNPNRSCGLPVTIQTQTSSVAQQTQTILNNQSQLVAEIFSKNLKYKTRSNDVILLQQFLQNTGYLPKDEPTNYFGASTKNALSRFQSDNNLSKTGELDLSTRKYINLNYNTLVTKNSQFITETPKQISQNTNSLTEEQLRLIREFESRFR